MSEGLTYPTKSQAVIAANDYKRKGLDAVVKQVAENEWRVYVTEAGIKRRYIGKPLEEAEIAEAVRERLTEREIERLAEPTEEEEIAEETRRAIRRLAVKKAMEKQPEEIERASLKQKQEQLKELIDERKRTGHADPGIIVPVFDPETKQIIDYRLETRETKQRLSELVERGARKRGRKTLTDIGEAPITASEFTGEIVRHMARQIDVKKGMRASIPGQAFEPRAVIAALPKRDTEAIGRVRPAIGKIGQPGLDEANALGVRARGFGTPPSEPPLKTTPRAMKISANGMRDVGFARIPRLEKRKETEEAEDEE